MISKKIIEMMGGEVGFHSEVGKGSNFWIEMSTMNPISEGGLEGAKQLHS
jgi:signal transduction histidine kinase